MTQFRINPFAVIFDKKDCVLLSHWRDIDIWNLPGGVVENGELSAEAGIRETQEEIGLKVEIKDLVGVHGKSHKDEFSFVFLGVVNGGNLKKSKEADKHRVFKLKKIPKNTIPKNVERIQDTAKIIEKPVFHRQKAFRPANY